MDGLATIFLRAVFVENLALAFFLGMCTFLAVSRRIRTTLGVGAAVMVVLGITVPVNNVIHTFLLREGALAWAGIEQSDFGFLALVTFIGVIAASVQVLEMALGRWFPALHQALGIFLPLLTVNCAVLGAALFMVQRDYDLAESAAWGLGAGAGWALAVVAMAGLREKLRYADPPEGLRGLGLTFITAGLMSMAFMALAGA